MTTIVIDINVPKRVRKRLSSIGYNTIYLTEVFDKNEEDEVIMKWLRDTDSYIITRDKSFSKDSNRDITLYGESEIKLARQALMGLLSRNIYPSSLRDE